MPELFLRPTVIGGDTLKADFVVIYDGRGVGRIRLAEEREGSRGIVWDFMITVPLPIPPWGRGSTGSLEDAKDRFKVAWEQFLPTLTEHDVQHWHHHQDAADRW